MKKTLLIIILSFCLALPAYGAIQIKEDGVKKGYVQRLDFQNGPAVMRVGINGEIDYAGAFDDIYHRLDSANTPFTAEIQVQTAGGEASGFLLLADGSSYLLLADGVSKLIIDGEVSVITIAGASITSDAGEISFGDDNITTTGIITGDELKINTGTDTYLETDELSLDLGASGIVNLPVLIGKVDSSVLPLEYGVCTYDGIYFIDYSDNDEIVLRCAKTDFSATLDLTFNLDEGFVGIDGNFFPDETAEYSLGSSTLKWVDLWLSGDASIAGEMASGTAKIGDATNYTEIKADGEINLHGTAKVYKQKNFVFNYSKITGQGAPTLVERGIFQGFSLPVYDADDEELHACICIPGDWDGATDPVLYVGGWLDTANTTKKFKLQVSVEAADFENNAVVPITTNDIEVETTTGTWSQYTAFKIAFTIDHSAVLGATGQPFAIRIRRIDASADEITGEVVVEGALVIYVANKIGGTT